MTTNRHLTLTTKICCFMIAFLMFWGLGGYGITPAYADHRTESRQLVVKAKMTFENFYSSRDMDGFRNLLRKARGVFIAPEVLKGAFIFGVSGGSGVLLARNSMTGRWSDPAFYTMGGASFGLQAGAQASEVIILVMTQRGVNAFLNSNLKLGADIGVAAGPVGIGAAAATANLSADLIAFTRAKGLFGGISLDGTVVKVRDSLNHAYYARTVSPRDILIFRKVSNPQAAGLIQTVAKDAAR